MLCCKSELRCNGDEHSCTPGVSSGPLLLIDARRQMVEPSRRRSRTPPSSQPSISPPPPKFPSHLHSFRSPPLLPLWPPVALPRPPFPPPSHPALLHLLLRTTVGSPPSPPPQLLFSPVSRLNNNQSLQEFEASQT